MTKIVTSHEISDKKWRREEIGFSSINCKFLKNNVICDVMIILFVFYDSQTCILRLKMTYEMYGSRNGARELNFSKIEFLNKITLWRHHVHHTSF